MTLDLLKERERGIEAQWAREHDEELIRKLRERAKLQEISALLARKLRVEDPVLRQRVLDLGITHETGPALFLVPLVQVAWFDGKVSRKEREAILGMAAIRGVAPGSPVHAILLEWFAKAPGRSSTKRPSTSSAWESRSCPPRSASSASRPTPSPSAASRRLPAAASAARSGRMRCLPRWKPSSAGWSPPSGAESSPPQGPTTAETNAPSPLRWLGWPPSLMTAYVTNGLLPDVRETFA